jgi:hypothetical protein
LSQLSESGLKSVVRLVVLELQLYAHIATARCIFFSERRLVASRILHRLISRRSGGSGF